VEQAAKNALQQIELLKSALLDATAAIDKKLSGKA
jgi:hypothetical protein